MDFLMLYDYLLGNGFGASRSPEVINSIRKFAGIQRQFTFCGGVRQELYRIVAIIQVDLIFGATHHPNAGSGCRFFVFANPSYRDIQVVTAWVRCDF
jgi:hypothetical protein